MDWIDEKIDALFNWIRHLSFRKAMLAYIGILALLVGGLSYLTMIFCWRWELAIWNKYGGLGRLEMIIDQNGPLWWYHYEFLSKNSRTLLIWIDSFRIWCPFLYAFIGMVFTIFLFYRKRLARPLSLLKTSVEKIRQNDLDFTIQYDSRDELGQLCDSMEEMRLELSKGKKEMWRMVERQKELNAAFAHDLRTPLTVLHGYTDFLARYLPEGKLSQEKLQSTLALMSQHLQRLEAYSRTMKGIRSMDELPFTPEKMTFPGLHQKIREILFALNQVRDIRIQYTPYEPKVPSIPTYSTDLPEETSAPPCSAELSGNASVNMQTEKRTIHSSFYLWADEGILLEVLENLLSNAIRFAETQIEVASDYDDMQGELLLSVRDDGPGFSEEQAEKALKPYYQDYRADSADEHFGIGLHICRELCKKHGGTLSIANSIRGGAVVTASFSAKEAGKNSGCTAGWPNVPPTPFSIRKTCAAVQLEKLLKK